MSFKDARFIPSGIGSADVVDVHGPVRRLCCNVLVHRVPRHTLDEVIVFGNLVYTFPCQFCQQMIHVESVSLTVYGLEHSCHVICASCDQVLARGAPS